MFLIKNLLDVFRPKRWYRNLTMVFGVLIAVKVLDLSTSEIFSSTRISTFILALVSLCLVASANYGINEILDAESDSHHPQKKTRAIPSGRVSIKLVLGISLALYVLGLGLSFLSHSWPLIISIALLAISGFVYNVPPIRLKDRAYIDFTSEALNNAIRLMVGWYAVANAGQIVPASFLLAYWFLGVFLMAAKRFGEIRLINDVSRAAKYRASLQHYNQENLLMSMIGAVSAFSFMLGALSFKYSVDIVLVLPFIIVWIIWFLKLAYEENTIVKDPERIFEKKSFLIWSLLTLGLFAYCFYTGDQLLHWVK
jgi:decaprenyl-phosphate phosphoribosyltransferase